MPLVNSFSFDCIAPSSLWHRLPTSWQVSPLALSVNAWVPHPTDPIDRVQEAVTRFVFGALVDAAERSGAVDRDMWRSQWVSPTEWTVPTITNGADGEGPDGLEKVGREDTPHVLDHGLNLELLLLSLNEERSRACSSRGSGATQSEWDGDSSGEAPRRDHSFQENRGAEGKETVMRSLIHTLCLPNIISRCVEAVLSEYDCVSPGRRTRKGAEGGGSARGRGGKSLE